MSEACNAAHLAALAAAHEAAYGIAETGETPVTARSVAAREGDRTIGTCGKQRKAKQQQIPTAGAAQRGVVARTAEPAVSAASRSRAQPRRSNTLFARAS